MENENQKITLKAYEETVQKYADMSPTIVAGDVKKFIDELLTGKTFRPKNVFEIGSGTGRDADYMESLGVNVIRTDAVKGFIDYQSLRGKSVWKLDILENAIPGFYEAIFANGVFLHFTEEQFSIALQKVWDALVPGGYFAFSMKLGNGEKYSSHKIGVPRYFKYWEEYALVKIIQKQGFLIDYTLTSFDEKWILMTAFKNEFPMSD
jgi:SAM-dependent methyltransferase